MSSVAISFSGLPRFPSSYPTNKWREIINKYNADVFVHTWIKNKDEQNLVIDRILHLYNPKVLKYEPPRSFNTENYYDRIWPTVNPYNVFSSFTSIYESMKLINEYTKTKNFSYEYVIRARFDVVVSDLELKPVDGVAIPDVPAKQILKFKYKEKDMWGIDDLAAFGSQEVMTKYSNTIENLDQLYLNEKVDMCPEIILTANLASQSIPIVFNPMKTKIVRRNGDNK